MAVVVDSVGIASASHRSETAHALAVVQAQDTENAIASRSEILAFCELPAEGEPESDPLTRFTNGEDHEGSRRIDTTVDNTTMKGQDMHQRDHLVVTGEQV